MRKKHKEEYDEEAQERMRERYSKAFSDDALRVKYVASEYDSKSRRVTHLQSYQPHERCLMYECDKDADSDAGMAETLTQKELLAYENPDTEVIFPTGTDHQTKMKILKKAKETLLDVKIYGICNEYIIDLDVEVKPYTLTELKDLMCDEDEDEEEKQRQIEDILGHQSDWPEEQKAQYCIKEFFTTEANQNFVSNPLDFIYYVRRLVDYLNKDKVEFSEFY